MFRTARWIAASALGLGVVMGAGRLIAADAAPATDAKVAVGQKDIVDTAGAAGQF